jgi:acyl-CoA thioester hydrolase
MTTIFTKEFQVGWGDLDSNGHMKNTAYLDYAATTRFSFFHAHGFSAPRFHEMKFGPIVFKDEVQFFKEMRLLDKFRVSFELDGMSPDGRIIRLMNEIFNEEGERSAVVVTHGAWFDLQKRKVVAPPAELLQVMQQLSKTNSFQEIVKDSRS